MGETPTVERLDGRPMERGVQRSRAGDILKAALAVIIVAAAVGAYAGLRYRPATPAPSHPVLRLVPTNDLLYCITQLAWSPDGRYVAALGNEIPCGAAPGSKAGLIYVYDAQTGKVAQKLHPDALVMGAPAVKSGIAAYTAPTNGPPTVDYFTLTWTPDGQALIMSFSVLPTLAGSSGPSYQSGTGVLRLAVGSRATSAVMIDTLTQFPDGDVERWDLQTGQPAMVPAPPAAAAYQWNSLGALTAIDATPDGPVGAPNSGQRFTVWQPGSLAYQQAPPSSPTGLPVTDTQDILWSANITPISPDGRYYYPLLTANGSLAPPSTQHPFAHEKILAPHDAALQALAQALVGAHSTFPGSLLQLAWRPDGKLLAALYPNASAPVGDSAFTISLYDTATGKLVKRLTPDLSRLQVGESGIETLSWSPDGKRLLLIDNVYGAITIWGPGALPA
jgi:WD40 repeat protein